MSRSGRCATFVAWLGLAGASASAQDALLVSGRYFSASRNFGEDLGAAPFVTRDQIFGGGRYAADNLDSQVRIGDARTGTYSFVGGYLAAIDRARPRIYVARTDGLWQVDVATLAENQVWPGDGTRVQHCALAETTARLYCALSRSDGTSDVVSIDVINGVTTPITSVRLPYPALKSFGVWVRGGTTVWKVSSDGRRLYFGIAEAGAPSP